jgi:hypothetical protein
MIEQTCQSISKFYSNLHRSRDMFFKSRKIDRKTALAEMATLEEMLKSYNETIVEFSVVHVSLKQIGALKSIMTEINDAKKKAGLKSWDLSSAKSVVDKSVVEWQFSRLLEISPEGNVWSINLGSIPLKKIPEGVLRLRHLVKLDLTGTEIEDLSGLEKMERLERLYLSDTPVTSTNGFDSIKSLKEIELSNSRVKDISKLAELPNLEYLDIVGTPAATLISNEVSKKLQQKLGGQFLIFDSVAW